MKEVWLSRLRKTLQRKVFEPNRDDQVPCPMVADPVFLEGRIQSIFKPDPSLRMFTYTNKLKVIL